MSAGDVTIPIKLPDRALWLRLPGSVWIWLRRQVLESLVEEIHELESERWHQSRPTLEEREHQGRTLLALRRVITEAAPSPEFWDEIKDQDETQADLFREWGYTPTDADREFVGGLVVDPDRDYPVALERLRKTLQADLDRPRDR